MKIGFGLSFVLLILAGYFLGRNFPTVVPRIAGF